ncbi:uncharacterized protein F4812DRAFT_464456 [Daldinia caldariorum]|uniref:uncharacterized protein n=1 Tax=Daldinia caldariorum TaxID=326644 RepID=UPI002007F096|nr:uncharacterized protein F4812DRAFT_464456 [Daldinia caldariorum]KAI1472339.1 hypothetical protein F4812DRAFT_464456 [Daldinia caldariorum]
MCGPGADPINGFQSGYIMATFQPSIETKKSGDEPIAELPNKSVMKAAIVAQEGMKGDKPATSATATPFQPVIDGKEFGDSSMVANPMMFSKRFTEEPPTTPQKGAIRPRTPSPAPSTPQPNEVVYESRINFIVRVSTVYPMSQEEGSATAPKRPRSPSPSPTSPGVLNTLSIDFLPQQQEFVFRKVFDSLKEVWDKLIKDFEPYFAALETRPAMPGIDQVRDLVMSPRASLQGIADGTAYIVHMSLMASCKDCPSRDLSDVQNRFLSSAAKIKSAVLEHVAVVNTLAPFSLPLDPATPWPPAHGAYRFRNPSPPRPSTPPARNRRVYSLSVEALRPRIQRLNFGGRNDEGSGMDMDINIDTPTPTPTHTPAFAPITPTPRTPSTPRTKTPLVNQANLPPARSSPTPPSQTPRPRPPLQHTYHPTTPAAPPSAPRRFAPPRPQHQHQHQHRTPADIFLTPRNRYPDRDRDRVLARYSPPYVPPARRFEPGSGSGFASRLPVVGRIGRYPVRAPVGRAGSGAAVVGNGEGNDDVFVAGTGYV